MAKDLHGNFTSTPYRGVVQTDSDRPLSERVNDTTAGATKEDATDDTAEDNAYSYGDDIKSMFDVTKDSNMSTYLDEDHEIDNHLLAVKQGNVEAIKMESFVGDKNKDYKVWRMQTTALQIACEKGCFQMVNLLKAADDIMLKDKIYDESDDEDTVSQEIYKMFAKANPAYLCLKEEDPVLAALKWPSEFKKLFQRTGTLSLLREKYKDHKRQLTQFTEDIVDCCLKRSEVETLLNGKDQENGYFFLHNTLKLADDAVRLQGKGFVTHRKSQLELQRQWLDGVPKCPQYLGCHCSSRFSFFLLQFCCWLFYGMLYPVHPILCAFQCTRELISSPKGKFLAEQFSAIFFVVALFVYEALDFNHPIVPSFMLFWILGYFVSEVMQIMTKNPDDYIHDIWNILDLLVIISFATGVLVRVCSTPTDSHVLLFLEKLPALTLVCAMLRRMETFYLSEQVGKVLLIFMEMKTEVCKFLVIFGYVVLTFACSFCLLYYNVSNGTFTPFLNFQTSLLHLTMKVFSETSKIEYLQLLNQNITVGGAQRNGNVDVLDASTIYDVVGFTLYAIFLMMAILILVKLCIAMMTNKYRKLQENIQQHWYEERSKIWLEFIRRKIIFPPPYNLLEIFVRLLLKVKCKQDVSSANAGGKQAEEADVIKSDVPLESVETGTQATEEKTKSEPLLEKGRTGEQATEEETKVQKKASPNVFKPSYEQLIKILKVRYYKFHGCKNCKIHGLMKEG